MEGLLSTGPTLSSFFFFPLVPKPEKDTLTQYFILQFGHVPGKKNIAKAHLTLKPYKNTREKKSITKRLKNSNKKYISSLLPKQIQGYI